VSGSIGTGVVGGGIIQDCCILLCHGWSALRGCAGSTLVVRNGGISVADGLHVVS